MYGMLTIPTRYRLVTTHPKKGVVTKFAKFNSLSHDAVIRVYDEAGEVIDRHAQSAGEFKSGEVHA